MVRFFLFILLFITVRVTFISANERSKSWAEHHNFTTMCMNEGLPCNFVDDLLKDSRGFLWIANPGEGVTRYDGYDFMVCNMGSIRTNLRSNFVRTLCEDDFGRIWTGGEMGIDVINIYTLDIEQVSSFEGQFLSFSNLPIQYIYKSKSGHLWLASDNALYRIHFNAQGDVKQILKVYELPESNDAVKTIAEVDDMVLFNSGIQVISLKENAEMYNLDSSAAPFLEMPFANARVQSIYPKENELWVGTILGLFRFNLRNGSMRTYMHDPYVSTSLSQNFITDITETNDHFLLVATLKGINVYNATTDSFERIDKDCNVSEANFHLSNRLNCDFINCMLTDGDVVWIGTEVGGLNKISRRKLYVENYSHSPSHPTSISKNPVNAIFEDTDGTLWVGTVEGGLNRKAKNDNYFTHYTTERPASLSHNSVSCFTTDDKDRLWVGTWGGGIGWIDPSSRNNIVFNHIYHPDYDDFSIGFVGVLCYDSFNNAIWVGTSSNIYVYMLNTGQIIEPFKGLNMGGIEGCAGYCIDRDNHLWIGLSSGLCRIDLHTINAPRVVYQLWRNKLDEPESKVRERVTYITESSDGIIWVGSNGYGLYQSYLDKDGDYLFKALTTDDGLVNNSVRGIREDKLGNMWVSTINGLSYYNREQDNFINYTEKDGLGCSQFYWNAIEYGHNGDLYLGSVDGLSVIKDGIKVTSVANIPMAFTHIRVSDKEMQPNGEMLRLHERDKSLYLEFAALDYNSPEFSAYSYRLKGFDEKWIRVSANRRTAAYTNLGSGTYHFELRYAPDGKNWQDHTEQLTIEVIPYFYKTTWFILLILVLVIFIAYQIWNWRIKTLKAQQELLHKKVEERTQVLQEQKKLLTTQTNELFRQNELLKQQNEKITKQKAQILKMSKKVQELTVDKLSFFTNITHEFRTPLTLIIGPIERALKLSYNPQVIEQLNFVERNSKYLLSLVNQLMDFRKVESGKLEINKTKSDLLKFIDQIAAPFSVFAGDRNITIRRFYRLDPPEILFDQDAMQKVITNLLSNAIKFTPDGGTVSLYVASLVDKESGKERLYISIKDTGTGIAEDDMTKIFNRFYQSRKGTAVNSPCGSNNENKNAAPRSFPIYGQSGTGIGLYLSKRIVQMHGGTIKASNNRKVGASFCISLPLSREEGAGMENVNIQHPLILPDSPDFVPSHFFPNRLTVLVVEDNKDMRGYIRSILSEQYNILEAENGAEALTILSTCNVDFIVSDLMMPVMDGIELSRKVKENFSISHIPFLMLTAKTSLESRIESYRTGVDEYLLKPFNEELLLTRMVNILENRKRYQRQFALKMDVDALNIEEESSDKKFLNKALEVIKANYMNPDYEATDFIEAMGVSKSLLNKKIQSLTGQSIGQFIRNYRLNIARELIEKNKVTRNMNISEIAYEVGFNDPKYFTRCFTKRYNTPPSSLLEE